MRIQELAELSLEKAVLIDFWAEWCGPCKTFGPTLDRVAEKYGNNLHLEKVDVDADPDMAAQFRVQSIPTIVLLSGGKIAGISQGALTEIQLEQWLKKQLPDLKAEDQRLNWREELAGFPPIPSEARTEFLENRLREKPEDKDLQLEYLRSVSFSNLNAALEFLPQFKKANENFWLNPYFNHLLESLSTNQSRDMLEENHNQIVRLILQGEIESAAKRITELAAGGNLAEDAKLRQFAIAFFSCLGDTHEVSKKYRKLFNMYLS